MGATSEDLATSKHFDRFDGSRSWACWVLRDPTRKGGPSEWWFLLPDHGIAIRLVHGMCISWDGRWVAHCTAVQDAPPGVHTLSFFAGMHDGARKALFNQQMFRLALRARQSGGAIASLPLAPGDNVWVRWVRGEHREWRLVRGVVAAVSSQGLEVDTEREGPQSLPWGVVHSCVVRAGAITSAGEHSGAAIVGGRVWVYWPGDDTCYCGVVTAFEDGKHTVEYDDGEVYAEVLGSEDTPFYSVM